MILTYSAEYACKNHATVYFATMIRRLLAELMYTNITKPFANAHLAGQLWQGWSREEEAESFIHAQLPEESTGQ